MPANRWLDRTQPQTLYMAVLLFYVFAFFGLFSLLAGGGLTGGLQLAIVAGEVASGFGIANERKWGYYLGVVVAVSPLVLVITRHLATDLIGLMFQIALLALLLHRQSREYQRIWFK